MNSTSSKLRKPLIAVQLLAAAVMIAGAFIAMGADGDYNGTKTFFGGVTAARIGAIAAFCAAVGVFIATYLNKLPLAGAAASAVISLIGFVINFILIPQSSEEAWFEELMNYGDDRVGLFAWMILAMLLLGIALLVISIVGLARKPRVNNQN